MSLESIYAVIILFQLTLNLLILAQGNYRKSTNKWFAGMNSSLIIWIFTIIFANVDFSIPNLSLIINKLSFISILNFTFFLFFFSASFSKVKLNIPRVLSVYLVVSTIILNLSVLSTDLVVRGLIRVDERFDIDRGIFYRYFLIFVLLNLIISIILLIIKTRRAETKERPKLNIVLYGLITISIIIVLTNAIIPVLTGTTITSDYGPMAIIIWLSVIFYNIRANQFLETKLLIGRILYYLLLGIITYCAFYLVIGLHLRLFNDLYNTGAYILGFAISIFYVILYNSINSFIRNKITSTLINPGFDPNETINELNKRLSKLLDYKSISEAVLTTLSRTIRSSYEALLLTPAEGSFQLLEGTKKKDLNISTLERCIYIWKTIGNYPIVYERVKDDTPYEFRNMKVWLKDVIEEMERSGIRVIVPLAEEKGIIGMLILGEKDADSMYSSIEVNFLDNLADTVSLAVNRSLLYTEVQDLNINLQKKVDSATADLKDKNVKLGDALTKLEEARRQERDMIDVMGHELRTPITIVRNALSVLDTLVKVGEGKVDPKKLTEYVDMSLESARRELALVETLLSATKIEATRMQVSREKVDMLDVIHDGIEGQKHQAEAKGLEIKFTKPEGEYYGYADRLRIQEVMDNLLSNAVKYTQQGYVEISINKIEKDGMIKVSIKDTGMGISEDDIKNLGKKFFRAKQYINEKEAVVRPGGTGLGLYVVFGLVDKMGGKIEIQSELGKGSIFSFIIPLYINQKQEIITEKFSKDRVSRLDPKVEAELRKEEVEKTDDKNKSEDKILTP